MKYQSFLFKDIFSFIQFIKNIYVNNENDYFYPLYGNDDLSKFRTDNGKTDFTVHINVINQFNDLIINNEKQNFVEYKDVKEIFDWTKNNLDKVDKLMEMKNFL